MKQAAERMQVPFALAMARVSTLIEQEGLTEYTFAYVWLFQVLALSASLYGPYWITPSRAGALACLRVPAEKICMPFRR